jgi:hypothetical protein
VKNERKSNSVQVCRARRLWVQSRRFGDVCDMSLYLQQLP